MTDSVKTEESGGDTRRSEHSFQAEVNQVLSIVINSLYSHREIFLRELVSNAADAIDKLRFRALTEHEILGEEKELEIRIEADEDEKTLTISDNGIGMSRDEMITNLGTIAHSGSQRFLDAVKEKGQSGDSINLIGQFGVGFYSSFLVADRVEVRSRAAGSDESWCWSSKADGHFEIEDASEKASRGTEIKLFLGEENGEYLEDHRIRNLIERYSDYVGHPIKLKVTREEGEDDDKKTVEDWEAINKASALWKRPRNEITEGQYEEFYKHLTHDWEAPLARTHFTIEGTQLFTGLLFIPGKPPFDLMDRDHRRGIRLYVKRVFIMDDCEELLPVWLRFVKGVVDSDDLPLNVSRELLQEDRAVKKIRKGVVRKTLDLLEKVATDEPDDYRKFWEQFGVVLKEGLHFDGEYRDRLAKLVRYASSKEEYTSLDEYVERMPEDQEEIYYVIGPSINAVEGSPHAEVLKKKGFEVLHMIDPVDEWAVESLKEFEGKKLVSAMRAELKLDDDESDETKEERQKEHSSFEPLTVKIQEVLDDHVSEVRISERLTDSPCCLVVPEGGMHAHIERMIRAQNKDMPATKRILELNPSHDVIQRLRTLNEGDGAGEEVGKWTYLLYDQALLAEGSPIADPPSFARRMASLMSQAIGGQTKGGPGRERERVRSVSVASVDFDLTVRDPFIAAPILGLDQEESLRAQTENAAPQTLASTPSVYPPADHPRTRDPGVDQGTGARMDRGHLAQDRVQKQVAIRLHHTRHLQRHSDFIEGRFEPLLVKIDADPDDPAGAAIPNLARLDQDARQLARSDQDIVGPFQMGFEFVLTSEHIHDRNGGKEGQGRDGRRPREEQREPKALGA